MCVCVHKIQIIVYYISRNHIYIEKLIHLCWCSWSVMPPETMLVSVVCAPTGGHTEVSDLYCHQRPYGGPWSTLMLEVMWMSVVSAVARNHMEVHDPRCC